MGDDLVLYTAAEVADMLRLNLQVVQRKLQAGEIPGYRIGREWRVERSQLRDWLEEHSNQRVRPLADRWFDSSGRLNRLPKQRAKRRAVLERITSELEPGRDYNEAAMNSALRRFFDDVALLRRELLAEKLIIRPRAGTYQVLSRGSDPGPGVANRIRS